MKIAFFSKHLPSDQPNGVSVQVDRLAAALVGRGHAVTCFSLSPPPAHAPYVVEQLPRKKTTRLLQKFMPAIEFHKINKRGFDILHFHGDDYLCAGAPNRVRTFYGSALFEAIHAKSAARFMYQAFFYLLEWASCYRQGAHVAISRATRHALPLVPHTIPCGVPLEKFTPLPSLKTTAPSLLFIGDFKSRKRGDLLLRVFRSEILPKCPECLLTIVGPERVEAPNVRCLGRIDEDALVNEYRKAWIYCLPSSYEGFGVPAIEAMACGTAVVATRNAGVREIFDQQKTGIVCTPDTLGSSIIGLIETSAARENMIVEGLIKVREYDMREIAKRYESLYATITATL
jgi:phosphatidyl-myo-inositol alpha-mannosyltransferase